MKSKKYLGWGPGGPEVTCLPDGLESAWYVRAEGTPDQARGALESCSFLGRAGAPEGEVAFLAPAMTHAALDAKLAAGGLKPRSVFRVLD